MPPTWVASRGRQFALIGLVASTLVVIFAVFIWPTPYRYEKVERAYGTWEHPIRCDQIYRISRWSGQAELLIDTTPQPPKPSASPSPRTTPRGS